MLLGSSGLEFWLILISSKRKNDEQGEFLGTRIGLRMTLSTTTPNHSDVLKWDMSSSGPQWRCTLWKLIRLSSRSNKWVSLELGYIDPQILATSMQKLVMLTPFQLAPLATCNSPFSRHGIAMVWSKTKSSGVRFSCSMPSFERMRSALTFFHRMQVGKGQLEIVAILNETRGYDQHGYVTKPTCEW